MRIPPIKGVVNKVLPVKQNGRWFTQVVIIHVDAKKNEQGEVLSKEQFFVINIFSNKKDDSRFLRPEFVGAVCCAWCYLDGQRWMGRNDFEYNHKLNLDKWLNEDSLNAYADELYKKVKQNQNTK